MNLNSLISRIARPILLGAKGTIPYIDSNGLLRMLTIGATDKALIASGGLPAWGNLPVGALNSGTGAGATTFWRGDATWASVTAGFTLGTLQATTSGTTKDFTGIPAGTKLIAISFQGVSTGGNSALLVQIGDAGGFETSGYLSTSNSPAHPVTVNSTAGFIVDTGPGAAAIVSGLMTLALMDAATFLWSESHSTKLSASVTSHGGGDKALSAELTQVRITSVSADTFDAGSVNIMYIG